MAPFLASMPFRSTFASCRLQALGLLLLMLLQSVVFAERPAVRNESRLMMSWDQQSMWCLQLAYALRPVGNAPAKPADGEEVKQRLEAVIDEQARFGVDRITHVIFALAEGTVPPNMKSFERRPWTGNFTGEDTGIVSMEKLGYDTFQVMLDRTHHNGLQFLASLRMNDRHGDPWKTRFGLDHPDWRLKENNIRGFDFRQPGVRQTLLDVAEETLARYDVDGLEIDWMRHCHMFNPSEAAESHALLTQLMIDMRRLLDEAAARRGRGRLLLGARVPQTLEECRALGYDIATWARNGSVDFLCPSDFFYSDTNVRVEDFVAATRGTDCKIYPSVHPKIAEGHFNRVPSAANYNAMAKNYLSYGADGISVYNYHYHWRSDMGSEADWPSAMGHLTPLRELSSVARRSRHYLFYPMWPIGRCPTGAPYNKTNSVYLSAKSPEGSIRFRVAEDVSDPSLRSVLRLKITGLVSGDAVVVSLNGKPVAAESLLRTHVPDGRPEAEGRPLPAYTQLELPLSAGMLLWGDNQLSVQWQASANDERSLVAEELEVLVDPIER